MIAETAIENALKAELSGGGLSWSIAWPNQTHNGQKPYIRAELVRVNRRDDTLNGEMPISRGQLICTTVVEANTSTATANGKCDAIADLFPMGKRIAVTGGEIVILQPADIREGFNQDGDWRTPVIIDYQAS